MEKFTSILGKLDDASFQVKFHVFMTIAWLLLGIPTLLYWKESLIWVVAMSWYAIVVSHFTGVAASKAEVESKKVTEALDIDMDVDIEVNKNC